MNFPKAIFCAPDFFSSLETSFPDIDIIQFSNSVKHSRTNVFSMTETKDSLLWLLYQPLKKLSENLPVMDHINLSSENPLIGPNVDEQGPRFPDMSSVYTDREGAIAVFGDDEDLKQFKEPWFQINSGVWEAIALKHHGYKLRAWLIADLKKWVNEHADIN